MTTPPDRSTGGQGMVKTIAPSIAGLRCKALDLGAEHGVFTFEGYDLLSVAEERGAKGRLHLVEGLHVLELPLQSRLALEAHG